MPYKPKKKPVKTKCNCSACGKEVTEFELFAGVCKCKANITKPGSLIIKL